MPCGRQLIFAEDFGLNHNANTQSGMILVIVDKILAVSVIVLNEKKLVIFLE